MDLDDFFEIYFTTKKILTLDRGYVDFKLYKWQKDILEKLVNSDRNFYIRTPRQSGKNTIVKIYLLYLSVANVNYHVHLIFNNHTQIKYFIDSFRRDFNILNNKFKISCSTEYDEKDICDEVIFMDSDIDDYIDKRFHCFSTRPCKIKNQNYKTIVYDYKELNEIYSEERINELKRAVGKENFELEFDI